jgi:hypothetical protein
MPSRPPRPSEVSRLFSSGVFKEMAGKGRSPRFARLVDRTGLAKRCAADATVGEPSGSAA